jgi:hypothetical protein
MNTNSKIEVTWAIVARRNGLSRKRARKLFPKVMAYAIDHFEVVRLAVREAMSEAIDRITAIEVEVRSAMASFDASAARLLATG